MRPSKLSAICQHNIQKWIEERIGSNRIQENRNGTIGVLRDAKDNEVMGIRKGRGVGRVNQNQVCLKKMYRNICFYTSRKRYSKKV